MTRYVGRGAAVRNCHFRNTLVNGIRLATIDATVQGNRLDHIGVRAIVVSPDLFWKEATFGRNVVIEENTIEDPSFAKADYSRSKDAIPVRIVNGGQCGLTEGSPLPNGRHPRRRAARPARSTRASLSAPWPSFADSARSG